MLRKLIAFAITSGLAKKAWDHYLAGRARTAAASARGGRRKPAAARKATTVTPKSTTAR